MKDKYKLLILSFILLSIFGFILVLNYNTSLVSDDYIYQFVFENRMPTTQTKRQQWNNKFKMFYLS